MQDSRQYGTVHSLVCYGGVLRYRTVYTLKYICVLYLDLNLKLAEAKKGMITKLEEEYRWVVAQAFKYVPYWWCMVLHFTMWQQ